MKPNCNFAKRFSFISLKKVNNKISRLCINNGKKRNALSFELLKELRDELDKLNKLTDESSSIIILETEGSVFSSGHDLKELMSNNSEFSKKTFDICGDVMMSISNHRSVFISQVQGLATAAGLQLAATCDISICSSKAEFATPGVKVGLFCTTPYIALSNIISPKRAMHMLLTGENIDSKKAEEWGLVNMVVDVTKCKTHEEEKILLENETLKYAEKIAHFSSSTYSFGKKAFKRINNIDILSEKYTLGSELMCKNLNFDDTQEGIKAFIEKRKPNFKH